MSQFQRVSVPHVVVFASALVADAGGGGGGSGRRMRPKRGKYVSWGPMVGIVSTRKKLIGNGKKNLTAVLAKIKSAIEASEGVGSFLRELGKSNGGERGEEEKIARGGNSETSC